MRDGEVDEAVTRRVDDGIADERIALRGDRLRCASESSGDSGAWLRSVAEVGYRGDVVLLGVGQPPDSPLEEVLVEVILNDSERGLGILGGDPLAVTLGPCAPSVLL
jgi:hypothetical protein